MRQGVRFVTDAIVTLTAVLVVFAAFDDITTDTDTSFAFEYMALVACALALLFVVVRTFLAGHRVLAGLSFVALAIALWGQRAIRPGLVPGFFPEYIATAGALLWFAVLSLLLLALGWRAYTREQRIEAR